MTYGFGPASLPDGWSDAVLTTKEAEDCLIPMGVTSENVAEDYGITRAQQDAFAAKSFQKAAAAAKAGRFRAEIAPLSVKWVDPKTEQVKQITVSADDGIRDGVTAEGLSKLKPAFKKNGTTHAGNASQVSDGAAAVLLARRSTAKRLGLPIVGKFVAAAVAGVPPRVMGIGPAYAIPKVLKQTGLKSEDVDFFEINEAFASQAVYSIEKLGLPYEKVNLNGGAIAIGHPLGMSEFFCPRLRTAEEHLFDPRFFFYNSRCASDCYWLEYCKADRKAHLCDEHVCRFGHGYGCRIRERALSECKWWRFSLMYSRASVLLTISIPCACTLLPCYINTVVSHHMSASDCRDQQCIGEAFSRP